MNPPRILETLAEVFAEELAAKGWRVETSADMTPYGLAETLHLYAALKSGKTRRTPSITLTCEPGEWIAVADNGQIDRQWIGPRFRPWSLRGEKLKTQTWADAEKAALAFFTIVGLK